MADILRNIEPENDFLVRGWSFPPTFRKNDDGSESYVQMSVAREDIDESLDVLLSTSIGERIMQPLYGCNMEDYQFESMSSTLLGFIRNTIENALLYHEARIKVEDIRISEAFSPEARNGFLKIEVDYVIRSTNSRFNFVYKYYLQEGNKSELYQSGRI